MVPQLPGIGAEEIDFLIQTSWLDERDAGDRRKVGEAIARMLASSAGERSRYAQRRALRRRGMLACMVTQQPRQGIPLRQSTPRRPVD
jgi:hypothetical protein